MAHDSDEDQDDDDLPADAPRYSGRWAIIAVTLVATLMASYAWWHHRDAGQRALAFWTPETALLISRAPTIEIIELGPLNAEQATDEESAPRRFGDLPLMARRSKLAERAANVPGLGKACTILLQDNAFAWLEPVDACQPVWQYAIEFREDARTATVLISLDCPRVKLLGRDDAVSIRPIAEPLREFLVSQLPSAATDATTPVEVDTSAK
ncbi:MAG: hypothetical protein AB7E74_21060 [Pirellulales bacterium]